MQQQNSLSKVFFFTLFFFVTIITNAQSGLNFQGVARNSNNVILASQPISLRLSIIQGNTTGTAEYTETRNVTTNAQGLFTVVIGEAGALTTIGNFTSIIWKNTPKYLKIEMDAAAGTNFTTIGTTQFQSVAYAQFANSVDAENIAGIVPVARGGTGTNSLIGLKAALALDKSSVGLMNVDNTTDALKPISIATQTAIDFKLSNSDTVSLSNRINLKVNITDLTTSLALKVDKVSGKDLSTNDYTTTEKTKLASIIGTNTGDQDLSTLATKTALALKANSAEVNTNLLLKENVSNKSTATDLGGTSPSDILYPTQKAVKDFVAANAASGGIADGGISTIKIADLAVTDAKLATGINKSKVGLENVENTSLSTWTGSNNISSVGTINSGTWSGTTIDLAHGGTGASTASVARTNLGLVIGTDVLAPTGNAATATKLATARSINGVAFDGSGDITISATAEAGTLTGTTLASNVLSSSLTSVGTLTSLTNSGNLINRGKILAGIATETSTSAVLEVSSTTQGFLPPRMTSAQRNAIITPAHGLVVWCNNCGASGELQVYCENDTWTNLAGAAAANAYTPSIGETYRGGKVAYILVSGDPGYDPNTPHGLIAAASDQSSGIRWYNGSDISTGATGTAIGTGLANTNAIISSQGATSTSYAAGLARAYAGGGYTDWFLPSQDELHKLYLNKFIGGFSDHLYWSSTEAVFGAWFEIFAYGAQTYGSKVNTFYVRAIRSF